MRPASLALASIVGTFTLSSGAAPFHVPRPAAHVAPEDIAPRRGATARAAAIGPAALRFGRSIGSPTEGRLVGGMHLDEAPYLRVAPAYGAGDARWGLEPLVAMIARAARAVRRQFSEAILTVGHLSRAGGGDIERHRSHESGRDADISFFARTASGKQLLSSHFVAFRGDGAAVGWPGAYFDDAKNWALVSAMVTDPEAHVTHLFVAAPLRARLLAYAERMGVSAELRMRAAETMQQPHGALPHDDHFHVRIGCPGHMSGCVENPTARTNRLPAGTATQHGRRGGLTQGWATPAPRRAPLDSGRAKTPGDEPARKPDGNTPAHKAIDDEPNEPNEPDAPPASIATPFDDVDG